MEGKSEVGGYMNHCLWCHEEIMNEFSWKTLLFGVEGRKVCDCCQERFSLIKGETCKKCFRESKQPLCYDCRRWEDFFNGEDPLVKNVSTYTYNSFMQEVVAKWKYRGDYELVYMFTNVARRSFYNHFRAYLEEAIIVPIPLSKERLEERHFNQSLALANTLMKDKRQISQLLSRINHEKQAKKTRRQRIFGKNPFKLEKKTNKTVILVDDIYTTGTTIRHAASLLLKNGCPQVFSYTLIRG